MSKPTTGPWSIVEHINDKQNGGYISIAGPNGEHVADIFPFGNGPGRRVGLEKARANAAFIVRQAEALR